MNQYEKVKDTIGEPANDDHREGEGGLKPIGEYAKHAFVALAVAVLFAGLTGVVRL